MQSSLWKLAVITGVVALCLLVIDHARKDMSQPVANPDGKVADTDDQATQTDADEPAENVVRDAEIPTQHHAKTGDEVSRADHVVPNRVEHIRVADTQPVVPLDDPFGDGAASPPRELNDQGLPASGQDEPAGSLTTQENDTKVPELWDDVTEPEVTAEPEVAAPAEEDVPPLAADDPVTPLGVFDAAAEAEDNDFESFDPLPDEFPTESETADADAATEELPVEEAAAPIIAEEDPFADAAVTETEIAESDIHAAPENVTSAEPVDEAGLFDLSSDEPDPFAGDVGLPTPSEGDAPADDAIFDETTVEPIEEMPAVGDDPFAAEDTIPAAESLEAIEADDFGEPDAADADAVFSDAPELPGFLSEDERAEPAAEAPAEEMNDVAVEAELVDPEPAPLAETELEAPPVEFHPETVEPDSADVRETPPESLSTDSPPLLSLPETDEAAPEEMLTGEAEEETTEAPVDFKTETIIEPEADDFNLEPLEEQPAEITGETTVAPADEAAIDPLPETDEFAPEILPTEIAPARETEPESPAEESEAAPDAAPVTTEEDVLGDGTVDATSPRGPQMPQMTIEKQSPPTAILGKPFIYSIVVKNVGNSAAGRVTVEDEIPRGAKLTGTIPQAELVGKKLIWRLGTLAPGQERKISIRVIPVAEGAIGSVATVNFVAEVAAETVVQKPELNVTITAPKEAPLGKPVVFQFQVANKGTLVAKKVVLRDILPNQFTHPGGRDLEYEIGDLPPGQTRDVQLTLTAAEIGQGVNQAIVTAEGNISVKAQAEVKIVDQGISITRVGPKNRLLKRATSFTNSIRNKAKSPVEDITVVEKIPEGMKFLKASQGGRYDSQKKTVTWHIQQIGGEESEDVSVLLLPEAPGTKQSIIQVFGESGEIGAATSETAIRGFALLDVEVTHPERPIEIGERVSYRIEFQNRGTEAASGVLASVLLPEEMKLISIKGPLEYRQTKQQIDFSAIADLPANQHVAVDVLLEAQSAGDTRLQVQVQSDQMQKPLTREAATMVFGDQP